MIHPEQDKGENGENEIILKDSTSTIKFPGKICINMIYINVISVHCWCCQNQGAFPFKSFLQILFNSISFLLVSSKNRMASTILHIFLRYKNHIFFSLRLLFSKCFGLRNLSSNKILI